MIGRIKTMEDDDGKYIELFDKNGDMFADIWLKGSSITPKRCKKFLNLHMTIMQNLEQFVPVLRKKQYAKILIDYIDYHTGHKCDCVDFKYDWGYEYDKDGDIISSVSKEYKYKKRKKK